MAVSVMGVPGKVAHVFSGFEEESNNVVVLTNLQLCLSIVEFPHSISSLIL